MNKEQRIVMRAFRVVRTCNTLEQLEVAEKWWERWLKSVGIPREKIDPCPVEERRTYLEASCGNE